MSVDKRLKAITLQSVAKALGVSRTTVSNAFNRPDQLSPELRDRILSAAKTMGYHGPHPTARMLRTGQTGTIGVVFSGSLPYAFSDPVAIAFLQGVAQVCEQTQASLLIVPVLESQTAPITIQQAAVDGFIVYGMPEASLVLEQVLSRNLPVIAVDQPNLIGLSQVHIGDRQAAREAAAHLLGLNHRRFAILAMDLLSDRYKGLVSAARMARSTVTTTRERLHGYEEALRAAEITWQHVQIGECPLHNSMEDAIEVALALLAQKPRPTAILAMSDLLAIAAIRAAERIGLAVPADVSVVGFDDIPLAAQIRPALTTIRQPLIDKGAIAARLLFEEPAVAVVKVLPTLLIVRNSSGLAPKDDS